jgi:gluconate 2-dehydrogenase gamma chain
MTEDALLFLNEEDASTIEAMAARIIPGDGQDPGAREAGVLWYIDRTLAGFHADLQPLYRRGLWELEAYCQETCKRSYAELDEETQDRVLHDISLVPSHPQVGEVRERLRQRGWSSLSAFFSVVRQQTIEGMFADPAYGGNRGAAGWKLLGFPGAQWGYSEEQMQPGFDAARIPVQTLADLRREHGRHRSGSTSPEGGAS